MLANVGKCWHQIYNPSADVSTYPHLQHMIFYILLFDFHRNKSFLGLFGLHPDISTHISLKINNRLIRHQSLTSRHNCQSRKSNLVQVFKFLRDIGEYGLDNAISMQGGAEYLRNAGTKSNIKLSLDVE